MEVSDMNRGYLLIDALMSLIILLVIVMLLVNLFECERRYQTFWKSKNIYLIDKRVLS